MRLVRPALVTTLTTALIAAVLTAAPTSAQPDAVPDARRGGPHFPYTTEASVPPGGYTSITTPPLPASADVLKVVVKPQATADESEKAYFDDMFTRVATMKSKGDRLLTCLRFHVLVLQDDVSGDADFSAENASLAILLLAACLQAAGLLERDAAPPSTARALAARKCGKEGYALPAELEKTPAGWKISVDGKPRDITKPKLRTTCRVKGHIVTYKVRATKKGKALRRVVGKRFGLGLQSPPDADVGIPVKITFSTP